MANIYYIEDKPNRVYALEDGDPAFRTWQSIFKGTYHAEREQLIGMDAEVSRWGGVALFAYTQDTIGEIHRRWVWHNQSGYEPKSDIEGDTDADKIDEDPGSWLGMMAGATEYDVEAWEEDNATLW